MSNVQLLTTNHCFEMLLFGKDQMKLINNHI